MAEHTVVSRLGIGRATPLDVARGGAPGVVPRLPASLKDVTESPGAASANPTLLERAKKALLPAVLVAVAGCGSTALSSDATTTTDGARTDASEVSGDAAVADGKAAPDGEVHDGHKTDASAPSDAAVADAPVADGADVSVATDVWTPVSRRCLGNVVTGETTPRVMSDGVEVNLNTLTMNNGFVFFGTPYPVRVGETVVNASSIGLVIPGLVVTDAGLAISVTLSLVPNGVCDFAALRNTISFTTADSSSTRRSFERVVFLDRDPKTGDLVTRSMTVSCRIEPSTITFNVDRMSGAVSSSVNPHCTVHFEM